MRARALLKVRMCDAPSSEFSADDEFERFGQIGYQTFPMIGQYGRLWPRARLHMGHSVAKRSVRPDFPKSAKGVKGPSITATGPSALSIDDGLFNLSPDIRGITQRGVPPRGAREPRIGMAGIDPDMIDLNSQFLVVVNRIERDKVRCQLGNEFFDCDFYQAEGR